LILIAGVLVILATAPLVLCLLNSSSSPGIAVATTGLFPLDTAINVLDMVKLRSFYTAMYVPELQLFRASYVVENSTVYIANDNVLASRALPVIGLYDLAGEVSMRLNKDFSGGYNGRIEVLFGVDIPNVFYTTYMDYLGEYRVNRVAYEIYWEKTNSSSVLEDWYEYADLLVYHALDKLLEGSRSEAESSFINLTRMWDGYGFRDKAFNGVYAVYKCSLFIYLYRALDYTGSSIIHGYDDIYYKCLDIVGKAQDPIYGGIHTDYIVRDRDIVITGDMNIETTSITILALYSNYPLIIGVKAGQSPVDIHALFAAFVSTITIVILVWAIRSLREAMASWSRLTTGFSGVSTGYSARWIALSQLTHIDCYVGD